MFTVYPDYAFAMETQIVLFFVNVVLTSASYYWGANITLLVYQKQVSFYRKLLFSVISASFMHLLVTYGVAYLNGYIVQRLGRLDIGIFSNFMKVMNPLSYFGLYLLGTHLLKLSKYQSAHIMRLLYVYYICCWMVLKVGALFLFPKIPDPRGWNYLRDIYAIVSGTLFIYLLYRLAVFYMKRYKLYIGLSDNIVITDIRRTILKNFGLSLIVYLTSLPNLYLPSEAGYEHFYMPIILIGYLVISMWRSYVTVSKTQHANKDMHIAMLTRSIEESSGIRHDFNNIMQTYSGYIILEDYAGLKQYHRTVVSTLSHSEGNLEVSRRMPEHPAFFSLIGAKLEMSKERNVILQLDLMCSMENTAMDALDFCRVLAILIDNAIEASEKTEARRVKLSCQMKPDGSRLFIISNGTADPVNTEDLFKRGYTTKSEHMGLGLSQVREILHRYGNCTFNISYYENNFIVYLEIKPDNA